MATAGVDAALFSVGPDLPYLTGYQARPSERLNMLVVPKEGAASLIVPRLEAPLVETDMASLIVWDETDDPLDHVATACRGARRVAIGDHTWSVFLVRLMNRLEDVDWVEGSNVTGPLRLIKDEGEVASLRAAAHAADKVAVRIPAEVRFGGQTEAEVAVDIKRMLIEEGHQTAEFAIVGSGPNGASPHHDPGERLMGAGDAVVCDFGGTWDGYHSDLTRTFSVGEPDATALDVHRAVHEANRAGREAVAPGIPCEEIDRAARKVVEEAGYGEFFIHRTGHGIGLEVHEHPYLVEGNTDPLAPGMAFSVEPGVYLPGRMGVRIEDIIVCGANNADELNEASRDLVVVE
jgi:Xaa-Pro aminopeptidase